MSDHKLNISVLPDTFAICRLDAGEAIPEWAMRGDFISITRTEDELSLLCPQQNTPHSAQCDRDWRAFKVDGPLPMDLIGIFASITTPLAGAGISIFALSTYETDYVLVKTKDLGRSIEVLTQAGHQIAIK
jgi:hypothetical protein